MPIRLKRVYEPPSPDDGERLLVMRTWPRGVRKEQVDRWDRGLAPSRDLLRDLNTHTIDWGEYTWRFLWEMANRPDAVTSVQELRDVAARETVTLLCWCPDEDRCHRGLLRGLLEGQG